MSVTIVGFLLIAVLIVFMLRGKFALAPVLVILPTIAALICGFTPVEIAGFINQGLGSVLSVVVLFAFAIIYFNILNDVGIFDLMIQKIMRNMKNRAEIIMIVTAVVAAIAHLDGSGATTVIITIPAMLPIYKKMKMSPLLLLLVLSISCGIMNMNPWCPAPMTLASSIGSDSQAVMRMLLPVQVFGYIILLGIIFFIGRSERKKGVGISDEEFQQIKEEMAKPVEVKVSKPLMVFDIILTVVLIVVMFMGWLPSAICFMIALSILVATNFKGGKAQTDAIRRHGPATINMVLVMMAIGAMTGIMQQTGMIAGMAKAVLDMLPESLGGHLVFIVALISPILGVVLGNAATHTAIAPVLAGVVTSYGATVNQLALALVLGTSLAANLSLVGAGAYLGLGLADVEMGDHLRYSFKWVFLTNTLMTIFAALIGSIAF